MFTFALDFISGETSASKSSMLNLILGEELLPFSVLSTISTICELKYGKKRIIKVHYKQEGKDPETKVLDDSSSYLELISTFVHVKSASLREKALYKIVNYFGLTACWRWLFGYIYHWRVQAEGPPPSIRPNACLRLKFYINWLFFVVVVFCFFVFFTFCH